MQDLRQERIRDRERCVGSFFDGLSFDVDAASDVSHRVHLGCH